MSEDGQSVAIRMKGEIDENINNVSLDFSADVVRSFSDECAERIDVGADGVGHGIVVRTQHVTGGMKLFSVAMLEERQNVKCDGVVSKVRGDIADTKGAIGRTVVVMRERGAGSLNGSGPAPMFARERLHIEVRVVMKGQKADIEQAGVRRDIMEMSIENIDVRLNVAEKLVHIADADVSDSTSGIHSEYVMIMIERFIQLLVMHKLKGKIGADEWKVGAEAHGFAQGHDCFISFAELAKGDTEVAPRVGIVGLARDGLAIFLNRGDGFSEIAKDVAQIVVGTCIVRFNAHGLTVGVNGFDRSTERTKDDAEIV
jgi:hypothetical protein